MTDMYKQVDGVRIKMTANEIAEHEALQKQWLEETPVLSDFDYAITDLRRKRNSLLAETDYYALSDVAMSPEMETYRQELRDITEGLTTVEDVEAVVFPTKP
jgi:oligoendopeptidase F